MTFGSFRVLGVGAVLTILFSSTGRVAAQEATAGPTEPAATPGPPVAPASEPATAATPPAATAKPTPAAAVAVAPSAPPAEASVSESNTPKSTGQEAFGFGAQLGFYNPNGVTVRVGARAIAVQVTAGFIPVLLSYGSSRSPDLKFLMPFEVTPQLVIHAVTFKDDIRGALLLGYRYNTALGHGATLGAQIEKRVSRTVVLEGMWGLSYYPKASDHLRGDQVPEGTSFNFPPELGYGLTVGILYYP